MDFSQSPIRRLHSDIGDIGNETVSSTGLIDG